MFKGFSKEKVERHSVRSNGTPTVRMMEHIASGGKVPFLSLSKWKELNGEINDEIKGNVNKIVEDLDV